MTRVAITRSLPEAEATAERVRALGAEPVLAPLIRIEPRPFDTDLSGAQALLFTSANGVRAFTAAGPRRDLPVLCVGDATANVARAAGFARVHSANDDSNALAHLVAIELDPHAGKVVHISGEHVASDLIAALGASGFTGDRRIAYEAVAATELPAALRSPLDMVLFHSARAGEIFARFGAPNAQSLIAACLSTAVAEAVSQQQRIPWKSIVVAPHPREDALLEAALAPTGAKA